MKQAINKNDLETAIKSIISKVPVIDIHTHLFSECFGNMFLYGIDELLTYHYLVAEAMRYSDMEYSSFFNMDKKEQAEFVWNTLFVHNTPVSEPARSIITIFNKLGLDINIKDLNYYREFYASVNLSSYIERIFDITGIRYVVMTNDPLDDEERSVWESCYKIDSRFKAALR